MYIAIAGNIGCGKTSLTKVLSERLGAFAYYEDSENPYIGDFYDDMNRWSFNLQIYFLGNRIREAGEMLKCCNDLVQDRTVYEDAHIFAKNLHEMGLMLTRDYETYMHIFELVTGLISPPDVMIYIKASVPTLISQIQKRGRAYEMSIQNDYLERLNQKYNDWIENIYEGRVITIDIDKDDFIKNPELLEPVIEQIKAIKITNIDTK